jgi:hypothetical protein
MRVFDFDPIRRRFFSRSILQVLPFRHDAFRVDVAHLLEQALPLLLDVIDVENARAFPLQEPFQPRFPLDQRLAPEIVAIQVQQVECEEQAFPPPEQQVIEDGPA